MRMLLFLCVVLFSASGFADFYQVQEFPGKIKVLVDIGRPVKAKNNDILFVVDNSGSMQTHQNNLSVQIDGLIRELLNAAVDFHIGVITTDMQDQNHQGRLVGTPRYVDPWTPNLDLLLKKNILVGTNGTYEEKLFDPVMDALSEPLLSGYNKGFYREGAYLSLVFVTDAEDQSVADENLFLHFLKTLKGDLSHVSAQGLIIPSDETNCVRDDGRSPLRIEKVISDLGGNTYSLCDPKAFENVWKDIVYPSKLIEAPGRAAVTNIPLPMMPVFQSITVQYGNQIIERGDLKKGWVYDSTKNEVVLGDEIEWTLQPLDTLLEVTFTPQDWAK